MSPGHRTMRNFTPPTQVSTGVPQRSSSRPLTWGFLHSELLGTFSASYDLLGPPTGPAGTQPYWLTYLYAPGGGYIGVISMGGPDLNASSEIHVFYDYATSPLTSDTYWGDTLSQLDSTTYGATTFGQMGVYETAVEIGDWNNNGSVIPASADIQSITVSTPDSGSTLSLLGLGFAGLAFLRRRFGRG